MTTTLTPKKTQDLSRRREAPLLTPTDLKAVATKNIAAAMNHIADVNADFKFDAPVGRDVVIPLGQGALDLDRALRRFQRAAEFYKESVTDGFDFGARKARKDLAQQLAMFFKQLQRKPVVTLRQRAVAHHVGEHDGGQLALFLGAHFNWSAASPILCKNASQRESG